MKRTLIKQIKVGNKVVLKLVECKSMNHPDVSHQVVVYTSSNRMLHDHEIHRLDCGRYDAGRHMAELLFNKFAGIVNVTHPVSDRYAVVLDALYDAYQTMVQVGTINWTMPGSPANDYDMAPVNAAAVLADAYRDGMSNKEIK